MIRILDRNSRPEEADSESPYVVLINKEADWTSFDVVNKIRRVTKIKKVGHAGTLDPFATGLLIIGLGKGTKYLTELSGLSKSYGATIRFGEETDTYDSTGKVVSVAAANHLQSGDVIAAVDQMRGEIWQTPPMYSAKKIDGQRLYKLARKNVEVRRDPALITVHEATIRTWNAPLLEIDLRVSKGAYIRSYAHDLGQILKVGAHLTALQRTAIDRFKVTDSFSIGEFIDFWNQRQR